MKVSVSRSVGRAFEIIELFKERRHPATATEVSRHLEAPHSSIVAVLHNLRDLGYLRFEQSDMTYFPTPKLLDLAAWLRPAPREPGKLGLLMDRVARETGHSITLANRASLFVNTLMVRHGNFTEISLPARNAGAAMASSISGLVLLAQLEDDEVQDVLRQTDSWLREAGARKSFDTSAIFKRIDQARKNAVLAGPHATCHGTEILAAGVAGTASGPLALSAHVPACLSRAAKEEVREAMLGHIRDHEPGLSATMHARLAFAAPATINTGRLLAAGLDTM